jgi:hypothetical protein
MRRRSLRRAALRSTAVLAGLILAAAPLGAVELRGETHFLRAPSRSRMRSDRWYAGEGGATVTVSVDVPAEAGVGLGGLTLQQVRGVAWALEGGLEDAHAFLGEPRRPGPEVPVTVQVDRDARRVEARFGEPVPPGATVTLAFPVGRNPGADTYILTVTALPAGPQPVGQTVGAARMSILSRW